jgi:hypothetical protein
VRQFTTGELASLQSVQSGHMQDTCTVLTYTAGSADVYGLPAETWATGSSYACGFEPVRPDELMDATEAPVIDARLRLPLAAESAVGNTSRIRLTKRYGVTITAQDYDIVGPVKRGPSGLVMELKLVTDGS